MKSALKVLLPLGLLLAVVFAVTFFSRVTPTEVGGDKKQAVAAADTGLEFFTATRKWDPSPDAPLQDQAFPGYYEPGETTHATQFWFRSRNPGKLTLRVLRVSCSACSGARVAPIPPDAVRGLLQMAAVSALPVGPVAGCPAGMAGAGAVLTSRLEWQSHAFADGVSAAKYDIPPPDGSDPWTAPWGILEVNFKVKPNPSVPLQAMFGVLDEGGQIVGSNMVSIDFAAVQPVEVDKSAIDAGVLADNTPGQAHVVTVFSSTRTAAELSGLSARVVNPAGGEAGSVVTAGRPEPVASADLTRLTAEFTAKAGRPVRVLSAFRLPVAVGAGGRSRPDIGRLERDVWVDSGVPGAEPRKVAVRATVAGPVGLAGGGTEINLGSFKQQAGASERVVLTTDRPEAALEVVPGEARPDFLEVALKKLPDAAGRGHWQLTVRVPPGRLQGELADGLVVLELKGPTPQRIRIPVRGRGVL